MIVLRPHYGHYVRILHSCADQSMTAALASMELTAAQGHIMGYLARCPQPPCPRDLEEAFQLSHPTVSGLLARLEKKEFIRLCTDESDRRYRRIHVLPKGRECQALMYQTILANEDRMVQGFTDEEKAQFLQLLSRAITNMGGCPGNPKHKEEDTP